jgi:DNA-binding HxlR family transcriptional regulator
METNRLPAASAAKKKLQEIIGRKPRKADVCPVKDVLHTLTDKWSMFVMMNLGSQGTLRFTELKNSIDGISQKMLTVTLKNLEASGLLTRTAYQQIPPKVEYALTAVGVEFLQHLVVLLNWACTNSAIIVKSRKKMERAV